MNPSLTIIEVTQITPSNTNSSESLTLPLTFYDLLWLKLHPVQRVIFYKLTDITRSFFDSVIVPNLKTSLSSSLSHYLPLAGKLLWNTNNSKPTIVYTRNDTVSFTVSETTSDFTLLTGNKPFSATELYPLLPKLQISDDSANIVSFQATLFPNQGFSISVIAHHAVLDGKTTTNFLKLWSHFSNNKPKESPPLDLIPVYDRTVIKSPTNIETEIINKWQSLTKLFSVGNKEQENPKSLKLIPSPEINSDVVRFTLNLTREDIQTLRERVKREAETEEEIRLSTFVITYSYALTNLIKARGGDTNRPIGFGFAVDCRNIVKPVIPEGYFGNCVSAVFKMALAAENFMGEKGFLVAVRMISDLVKGLDESVAFKIPELLDAFATVPLGTQVLSVAGSTRFGVYGLDFGWGKPEKVLIVSIDQGEAISLAESRDGNGGVEIGFSLKKHEMDVLIELLNDGLKK
ncbi:hypothetical protein AALP_AA6G345100 [Arabis alpina]|uniref:Uncharacterized protein n=1 Tax=Arabis alpina TaxID=50452 RepID=A0A087GTK9_ARAAL|nr:hypothetical protein AALP_AA6G345100 [Arabis alpina]